jgi:MYXO-CTERM domain-containing protein
VASVVIAALAIVLGLAVGMIFVVGAPWLALPILAVALVGLGAYELLRRRREAPRFRQVPGGGQVAVTEDELERPRTEDELRTLSPEPPPPRRYTGGDEPG